MTASSTKSWSVTGRVTTQVLALIIGWTLVVSLSLGWSIVNERSQSLLLAKKEARANFDKDQAYRLWATRHGGVYVAADDRTQPNPYLSHVPERDLTTPSGKQLTLMNPAFMLRQMMGEYEGLYGVRGRITSLKPLNPGNAPDEWEVQALKAFDEGADEVFEITELHGQASLRLMRPMITTKGCLKCHAHQGYEVGDVRGGVGVLVPMAHYYQEQAKAVNALLWSHGGIWLIGLSGILYFRRQNINRTLDQEQAHKVLEESEARFHTLVENAVDSFFLVDMEGNIADTNATACGSLGYSRDELVGSHVTDIETRFSRSSLQKLIDHITGSGVKTVEGTHKRKDGVVFPVEVRIGTVEVQGQPYLMVLARDISDRKESERKLEEITRQLQNVIDSMPSVLVTVDEDGRIVQWNNEASEHTGFSADDAYGRRVDELLPQFSLQMEAVKRALQARTPQRLMRQPHHFNNEIWYSDIMIYPLIANGVTGAVIRIDDVTERVRMEEIMVQTEKMMSVGGLAAGMAHEINNPLGGMLQGVQNVKRRLSPSLEKNRDTAEKLGLDLDRMQVYFAERQILRFIDGISEAGQRASDIVSNMLQFSRRPSTQKKAEAIAPLIEKTLELAAVDYDLKKKYDFRNIRIECDFEEDLPPVNCVASEIQQVLLNLLKNAAQALSEQKAKDELSLITLMVRKVEDSVRISVEDNGPGMSDEVSRRAFEPFFTTQPVGQGTGLGLSVSYFIVCEEHDGQMSVDSIPGKGTSIHISLPVAKGGCLS